MERIIKIEYHNRGPFVIKVIILENTDLKMQYQVARVVDNKTDATIRQKERIIWKHFAKHI